MASFVKKSTGIVGLAVEPHGRTILHRLYKATLEAVQPFPRTSFYRTEVEYIVNKRLAILEKFEDIPTIEREIGAGQIEEVIHEAKGHLDILPKLIEKKIWEHVDPNVPIVFLPKGVHHEDALKDIARNPTSRQK